MTLAVTSNTLFFLGAAATSALITREKCVKLEVHCEKDMFSWKPQSVVVLTATLPSIVGWSVARSIASFVTTINPWTVTIGAFAGTAAMITRYAYFRP